MMSPRKCPGMHRLINLPCGELTVVQRKLGLPALAIISDPGLFDMLDYPYTAVDLPIAWLGPTGNFLPLCGHATMATSLLLFSKYANLDEIHYASRAGIRILATRTEQGACIALPALLPPQPLARATAKEVLAILNKACNLRDTDVTYMGETYAVRCLTFQFRSTSTNICNLSFARNQARYPTYW